ncbi:MAG TPA: glycosyltransferase family 4 protein [Thermoanaerobaculia bacterium]|jgi:glycosyltransferase involved in cell wall biosynthesis|nr:glycosyltransferase family 4 protein [Thermoanaerobaculia bacterium]
MRVLIYTPAFLPQVGGLEINAAHLATQLAGHGLEIVVVTRTASDRPDDGPYRIVRDPSRRDLLRWTRWCDVFLQHNVSLRGLWPLLLVRRPWVASHHSWYCRTDGRVAWQDRLKRRLLRRAAGSIAVSRAVADDLDTPSVVIPNTYRDHLFRVLPGVPGSSRSRDLAFLGRLVSDKGADLLIDALGLLAAKGLRPSLTVIGDGPERPRLVAQARQLGVADQVELAGVRQGEELVRLLNAHRVLVVPSRYREPFGIVALEGIACGCLVVGSEGGGLKDAIGPCGLTFPNGDVAALAAALERVLADPELARTLRCAAPGHLTAHGTKATALAWVRELERAAAGAAREARR